VQKEITTLDVICFRGGDSNKEKKSLRTLILPY